MKKLSAIFFIIIVLSGLSCKKYLDEAYENPNAYIPGSVPPELVLPSIINNMHRGPAFDSRGIGPVIQYFSRTATGDNWERHGYTAGSDFGGDIWRMHYWNFGHNTLDMIRDGMTKGNYDYAAIAFTVMAWGWLQLTDYHGEVILEQAFDKTRLQFDYDLQEEVYPHALKIIDSAIYAFNLAGNTPSATLPAADEYLYQGNLEKWKRFAYGVKAKIFHRYWNKADYKPDSVIKYADLSFTSHTDDAFIRFNPNPSDATGNNFYAPRRGNLGGYRAGAFAMNLFKGTLLPGAPADPRLKYIFMPAGDGQYRGLAQNAGLPSTTSQQPPNFWGFFSTASPTGGVDANARTYFKNSSPWPVMTYSEIQFVKAEAAYRKGDFATALTAYKNGIRSNMDMLTTYFTGYTSFTPAERDAYVDDPDISPVNPADLTRRQILLQKYMALWGWGHMETFVDLRKENYDTTNIYTGYTIPSGSNLFPDNGGKPMYRVRPRYNSEYLWNVESLRAIGAMESNYHTLEIWFSKP